MTEGDTAYFSRRAAQERTIAGGCSNGTVALIHLQLADAYDGRLHTEAEIARDAAIPPTPA